MEHQLWKAIVALLATRGKKRAEARLTYSDRRVVAVYYWAVVHDRPTCWACCPKNWPPHLRRRPLPSPSRMSRRLRSPAVVALLDDLDRRVLAPTGPGLFWMIDGKPLTIGGCSKDRQAGYGRAAGGKAQGYKLHALVNPRGEIAAWRVAPMNKDEQTMAARLLRAAEVQGYVVGDCNYDSNPLHDVCDGLGQLQLIARRRRGAGCGLGHHRPSPGRLRCVARTANPFPGFADGLLRDRSAIERTFGNLVNWGGGLTTLPAWVRTHRRVRRWVQAKLVLAAVKRSAGITTCAA
jgi:Transposase DDE domain